MAMIRVLLVDDEPLILRGLRKLLDWREFGMEIVGEAYDAEEMWSVMDEARPDLLVCDINMPGASGIDVIRRLNESGRPVKTLFISAYRDFSYAQDALRYGAVEYLVKPIDKHRLGEALRKVVRLLDDQTARLRDKEKAERFETRKRAETIEELLERLTHGEKNAATQLNELGVIARSNYLSVCFGELEWEEEKGGRWRNQERKLVDFAVENVLSESILPSGIGFCFRRGQFYGLFFQHDQEEEAGRWAEELRQKIEHYLKVPFTIGIGLPVSELDNAELSARTALKALEAAYMHGRNRVIDARHISLPEERKPDPASGISKALERLVKKAGEASDEADAAIKELLEEVRSMAPGGKPGAVTLMYGILERFYQELYESGRARELEEAEGRKLLERMSGFRTFESMFRFVAEQMASALRQPALPDGCERQQTQRIIAYVEEHYRENLTLEVISAHFYMNAYYFSSVFKKRVGENFKAYLTKVRMKHALRLLTTSEKMVYEIAEEVGYPNARQFSRMFKKYYGQFPQDYRSGGEAEALSEEDPGDADDQ
ncbi:response regulator [Paenibacillus sp. HB172176]|uniref:response regulator transcription factor n=1 Tax=Paenibacillus sp. HB172176 TaxID=2493690 RepID=UPI00143B8AF6|nr:response regulator [Paenibacillus sp. HB172176]